MKNNKFILSKKNIIVFLILPVVLIVQFFLFKYGIISPQIKGIEIDIVQGQYIKDIDKYVVKLNKGVIFSAGNYVKFPSYAKNPEIEFKNLDEDKIIKIEDNSKNIKNTVKITGIKNGLTSVAIVKNNRILKKFNILVVDPKIVDLNTTIEGNLKYVGDSAVINNFVEVDFDRFDDDYGVEYKSSNENILKIIDNKIYAVGVGSAKVLVDADSKRETYSYNIVAKLKDIKVEDEIVLEIGEIKFIESQIQTEPLNLKTPKIEYRFSDKKLPIDRKIRLEDSGEIVGLREGVEKVTLSCGSGDNKIEREICITVIDKNIEEDINI